MLIKVVAVSRTEHSTTDVDQSPLKLTQLLLLVYYTTAATAAAVWRSYCEWCKLSANCYSPCITALESRACKCQPLALRRVNSTAYIYQPTYKWNFRV